MKKSHVSIISIFAIALLACVCTSCIYASEDADALTQADVSFTISPTVISQDDDAGTIQVEFNYALDPHGYDISGCKVNIYEIESRLGGESYKYIGEQEIGSGQSGSFVKELESNKGYATEFQYS